MFYGMFLEAVAITTHHINSKDTHTYNELKTNVYRFDLNTSRVCPQKICEAVLITHRHMHTYVM